MDRAGNYFLPCARLALNQNGAVHPGYYLYIVKDGMKSCAGANQVCINHKSTF
jgi:hypothetical protein